MNNLSGAARRVTRNLDQFSVICVFGSVVGCVVLPLMIQSMESFIITFVVLCLTAKPLRGRLFPSTNQTQETERRRSRERDDFKKSKKSSPRKKQAQVSVVGGGGSEQLQRAVSSLKEEDLQRQEQQRLEDRERRLEEKREKKARKREERLQRKEEEKREKEKEEQIRRERQEARIQRKKEDKERKQKTATFQIPTHENIQAMVNGIKPLKRERKHSTSSSASSISAHSTSCHAPRFQHKNKNGSKGQRHSAPFRAASDPEISMATRNSPTPVGKPWPTTLPSTNGPTHLYSMDMANRSFPSLPVVTSAPSSSSTSSSAMAAVQPSPSNLFPSSHPAAPSQPTYLTMYPFPNNGAFLQPSLVPTTTTIVPSGTQQSSTSWSSGAVPPVPTTMSARNHQQVCELPLHPHLPPQAAWLPVSGIQHVHSSETTCSGNNGVRYFSPAPGTMSIQQQQQSRFMGHGGTATTLNNGSLFFNSSNNSGCGTMNVGSTGLAESSNGSSNNNCYSLFSSGGGVGDMAPFSAVGGLLNLDTSTTANHVRHQLVSTGSPLSVSSDVSSDSQNSISDGGVDSCGRAGDQSDAIRQVETIGSASDKGHGVSVGNRSYNEWPIL